MTDLRRQYFDTVVAHEIALYGSVDRRMRAAGVLTLGRLAVLRAVASEPSGARVQRIAGAVGSTVGAASRLVDRLVNDGLVDRAPDLLDRRGVLVTLTAEGQTSLDASESVFDDVIASVTRDVHESDLSAAIEHLEQVRALLVEAE